jgi:hypothetical protein
MKKIPLYGACRRNRRLRANHRHDVVPIARQSQTLANVNCHYHRGDSFRRWNDPRRLLGISLRGRTTASDKYSICLVTYLKGEVKMLDFTERPERTEARAIMHLVCVGAVTLDEARELISIPEHEEKVLRMFVSVAGKDGIPIRSAVVFRQSDGRV